MQEHGPEDKHLEMLVLDAIEFARNFAADIAQHPLYVYYTALPLHPPDSILYQIFHDLRVHPSVFVVRGDCSPIAYSSDGRRYAVRNAKKNCGDIVVVEMATGQELLKIADNGMSSYVCSVAFSYDGSRIAVGTSNSDVYVWDSVSGAKVIGPLSHSGSTNYVHAMAWSTNGRLVSTSFMGEMILWDTGSAKDNQLSTMRLTNSPTIVSVTFSSDGSQIACSSNDGNIFLWDPLGGNIVWSVKIPDCCWSRVSFLSNDMGGFVFVKWHGGTQMRDPSTGDLLPLPDSLAAAVGLSRGGFMVNLLHQRIRKNMRWEDDEHLEWGPNGEYFAFRTWSRNRRRQQNYVVLLPKDIVVL